MLLQIKNGESELLTNGFEIELAKKSIPVTSQQKSLPRSEVS